MTRYEKLEKRFHDTYFSDSCSTDNSKVEDSKNDVTQETQEADEMHNIEVPENKDIQVN
jgi:hypothetical protein